MKLRQYSNTGDTHIIVRDIDLLDHVGGIDAVSSIVLGENSRWDRTGCLRQDRVETLEAEGSRYARSKPREQHESEAQEKKKGEEGRKGRKQKGTRDWTREGGENFR